MTDKLDTAASASPHSGASGSTPEARCVGCGAALDSGTAAVFTKCDRCFNSDPTAAADAAWDQRLAETLPQLDVLADRARREKARDEILAALTELEKWSNVPSVWAAVFKIRDAIEGIGTQDSSLSVSPASGDAGSDRVHGVCWVLIRRGRVLLERCPKKAQVLGVGEWFVPGGKLEPQDGDAVDALFREVGEEWPGVRLADTRALPILAGSAIPPGPRGLFLMQPYAITVTGELPDFSADGVELRWVPLDEALASPVPQVRMMVAAARVSRDGGTPPTETSCRFCGGSGDSRWLGTHICGGDPISQDDSDRDAPSVTNALLNASTVSRLRMKVEHRGPGGVVLSTPDAHRLLDMIDSAAPSLSDEERGMLRRVAAAVEWNNVPGHLRAPECRIASALLRRLAGPDTPPTEPIAAAPTPEGTNG